MKTRVAVLGAGSWGTTLASVLVENGCHVTLWSRGQEVADEINQLHTNCKYLPNVSLPRLLSASVSIRESVADKDVVLFVVPSHAMREVAREARNWINPKALLVHASKGFEVETWKRMSEVLAEELSVTGRFISVLSGPSHAEEVIRKYPTTVVVASDCQRTAEKIQSLLINTYFRVYTNADRIGVEVGGALKNIIALATGLLDGLKYGDNSKAALITRGLAEIIRLGVAMGAKPITFVGLAGVGDLVVTCTSSHSRNWRAGYMISQGKKIKQVLSEMGMVVEGVKTTCAAYALSIRHHVRMPLTEQLYAVLFKGKNPEQAILDLMDRGGIGELEEIIKDWD